MKITKRKAKGVLADMIANMDEDSLAKTRKKMERITEDYCSYEVAKLLKEKGFDEVCDHYVDNHCDEDGVLLHTPCKTSDLMFGYMCPTHQMAIKWLRDVRGLFVDISFVREEHRGKQVCWYYAIFELYNDNEAHYNNADEFPTYEEAVEAALKYALENLI